MASTTDIQGIQPEPDNHLGVKKQEDTESLNPPSPDESVSGLQDATASSKSASPAFPQEQVAALQENDMSFILDIPLEISVELGRTRIMVNDLLKLSQGSVVRLSKLAGETLDILANRKLIAKGEVVVVNDKYGIRLTEIISPSERVEKLG